VKRIYIGNLPFSATEEEVRELFEEYGKVNSVNLITDRDTGRFRGFGFIEMEDADAVSAIKSLNGQDFGDRPLRVSEARDRQQKPRGRRY
jgi:RNA recognition motif-containing protein